MDCVLPSALPKSGHTGLEREEDPLLSMALPPFHPAGIGMEDREVTVLNIHRSSEMVNKDGWAESRAHSPRLLVNEDRAVNGWP